MLRVGPSISPAYQTSRPAHPPAWPRRHPEYLQQLLAAYHAAPDAALTATIRLTNGRLVTGPVLGPHGSLTWVLDLVEGFPYIGRVAR